jgi:hypothetical protein
MPYQVLEFAEAVHHARRTERLLPLYAGVQLDAHALEEPVHLAVHLLVGLHGLVGALRVGTLLQQNFELAGALGVYAGQGHLHEDLKPVTLAFELLQLGFLETHGDGLSTMISCVLIIKCWVRNNSYFAVYSTKVDQ